MSSGIEKYNKRGVKTSYVSTIIGISLVLFMIGLVLGGTFGLDTIQKQAKENLQGDLIFLPELNEADVKQIELELKTWDEFNEVIFVSPDRALEVISSDKQSEESILNMFEGENPMPPTINFKPKSKFATSDGMKNIREKLLAEYGDRLEEVYYDESSVEDVNLGFKQIAYLVGAVALLLIVVAVAMINNTIRLALYSKRFSIKTMQLVGATSGYIRRPFLFQSIGIGLISGTIGMALLLGLFYAVNNVMETFEITYSFTTFLMLFASLLTIGIVITYISTWFALNKYLRMKLDDLY